MPKHYESIDLDLLSPNKLDRTAMDQLSSWYCLIIFRRGTTQDFSSQIINFVAIYLIALRE